MRHLDLFSGIGGFALAVRWLGHETVGFCEIDPWCRKVLDKHWPEVAKHDDIKTLRGDQFGPVSLVTAGWPCQPFSVAGKRRGAADDRALWPEVRRVIAESKPSAFLGENVTGIIGMELDTVLADLETLGYSTGAVVIPAVSVDAPHRRDRVWVMAHADQDSTPQRRQHAHVSASHLDRGNERRRSAGDPAGITDGSPRETPGATTHAAGQRQPRQGEHEQPVYPTPRRTRQAAQPVDGREGYAWPTPPRDGWLDDGLSADVERRLEGYGNAIVPQVAYEILRVMIGEAA